MGTSTGPVSFLHLGVWGGKWHSWSCDSLILACPVPGPPLSFCSHGSSECFRWAGGTKGLYRVPCNPESPLCHPCSLCDRVTHPCSLISSWISQFIHSCLLVVCCLVRGCGHGRKGCCQPPAGVHHAHGLHTRDQIECSGHKCSSVILSLGWLGTPSYQWPPQGCHWLSHHSWSLLMLSDP